MAEIRINSTGELKLYDSDDSNYVSFKSAGTVSSDVAWVLPSADGSNGQMLSTNLCPLLKICGPTSAVKFLNDQFENIHFISSVDFGGSNVNLISPNDVINKVNKILQSS